MHNSVCGLLGTDACVEMEMVLNGIKYQHDKSASGQTVYGKSLISGLWCWTLAGQCRVGGSRGHTGYLKETGRT